MIELGVSRVITSLEPVLKLSQVGCSVLLEIIRIELLGLPRRFQKGDLGGLKGLMRVKA